MMAPSKIQLGELWLGNPALQVTRASGLPRPAASPFCSLLWESYKLGNPLIKRCCLVVVFFWPWVKVLMLFRLAAMFPSRRIPRGRFWGGEEGACIWGGLALEERTDTDRRMDGWMSNGRWHQAEVAPGWGELHQSSVAAQGLISSAVTSAAPPHPGVPAGGDEVEMTPARLARSTPILLEIPSLDEPGAPSVGWKVEVEEESSEQRGGV